MEVMAGRRTFKEPDHRVSKGAHRSRKKTERRGEKGQEDRRTQDLEEPTVQIGDVRRVKSQATVGPIMQKKKNQSSGGGIH
ncbi:hypothetical protein NDU88_009532 [Pleurodeles waltl]|uniref:Uncharacterized protein n=1 Tax=Pleurodeles waltl TaxID=8319 RepID=A0AAV7P6W1_PLEWA|nr:hypothetical protein NDU88_009532 [Pleurodeles waltl]